MDLQALLEEYSSSGFGDLLYREALLTVHAVVRGHRYPTGYSPTGIWDDDAFGALAHDWVMNKLIRRGQLDHLLLTNQTLRGFRKGLELSFVDFLIGQRKRTALDNLFDRAAAILETDRRFHLFLDSRKRASRFWGLAAWSSPRPYQGSDDDLIAAGLRQQGVRLIHYRGDARKHSPVLGDHDLGDLLASLLDDLGRLLSLAHFTTIFAYRFDLLDAAVLSTEQPAPGGFSPGTLTLGDTLRSDAPAVDARLLVDEAASTVLPALSDRQRRALLAYARPDATLTSVAVLLGCSKSTVDNELRRALASIRRQAADADEAERIYARLLEHLASAII